VDEQQVAETAAAEAAEETQEPAKPSKGFLERTWDFFASVPVATIMIFIIAVASVAGTLITQEGQYSDWRGPAEFYPFRYGQFWGNFLYKTGMTRMYKSWWFLTLLFMLGASLVICSLERFIPLWRAVQRPNVTPPESFVKHLKNRFEYKAPKEASDPLAALAHSLKSARYKVIRQEGRLYADKGRWGRWGPYIMHIGLLLVLVGGMMRAIPGFYMDDFIMVPDGQVSKVPGTDYFVRNDKFTLETYDNGQPKSYKTDATIIEDGKEVQSAVITMNKPLMHRWVELYQSSYDRQLGKATVSLTDRQSSKQIGTFELDLLQPAKQYTVGDYKVNIKEYYPDFAIDGGKPISQSSDVRNPGVVLDVVGPDGKAYQNWYFVMYPEMEFDNTTPVKLGTAGMAESWKTGLKVKKDLGIPVIYAGLIVASLGVCLTFYLAHRRYWALVDNGRVVVGGWTNRNQGSLQSEMKRLGYKLDPNSNPNPDISEGDER
jgi:cytochrome c biogenesis protein